MRFYHVVYCLINLILSGFEGSLTMTPDFVKILFKEFSTTWAFRAGRGT